MLSGSIYDTPSLDSVWGFMMMRKYWYLVLDFTQCSHYATISWSLAKVIKDSTTSFRRIRWYCQISSVMSDTSKTNAEKLQFSRGRSLPMDDKVPSTKPELLLGQYLNLVADFLEYFNFNVMYPSLDSVENIFLSVKNAQLSEEARIRMLETINITKEQSNTFNVNEYTGLLVLMRVFCPMYELLVHWRSGHILEALQCAVDCVHTCTVLKESNILELITNYAHICLMGCTVHFLYEYGEKELAQKLYNAVEATCRIRGPEYTPILTLVNSYKPTEKATLAITCAGRMMVSDDLHKWLSFYSDIFSNSEVPLIRISNRDFSAPYTNNLTATTTTTTSATSTTPFIDTNFCQFDPPNTNFTTPSNELLPTEYFPSNNPFAFNGQHQQLPDGCSLNPEYIIDTFTLLDVEKFLSSDDSSLILGELANSPRSN